MASPAPARSVSFTPAAKKELIYLLRRAAEIEQVLLNAYLYAATSIKSTPSEFTGRRRALHFEKARLWKQTLINVARQEMMHLHYVQMLLRVVGAGPYFGLPERDADGAWLIKHWNNRLADDDTEGAVEVALDKPSVKCVMRFAAYESGDEVQDEDLYSKVWQDRFAELFAFEENLLIEQTVYRISDDAARKELAAKLRRLYRTEDLTATTRAKVSLTSPQPASGPAGVFQSIGDLYTGQILPLFEEAFAARELTKSNRELQDMLRKIQTQDHDVIPSTPLPTQKKFWQNMFAPMASIERVRSVIKEIVEEGEGNADFHRRTEELLAKVSVPGGIRRYATMLIGQTAAGLKAVEEVRNSHLYLFATVAKSMEKEGIDPAREPVDAASYPALAAFAKDLPAQFNGCYAAMFAWLSTIYLDSGDLAGEKRRQAIAMLTAWPLMSTAIRPLLELTSFFAIDPRNMFCVGNEPGAVLTPEAIALNTTLKEMPGRTLSGEHERIDNGVVAVLCACARWAAVQMDALDAVPFGPPHAKKMILTRLELLSHLGEIKQQLLYRIHGGYSETLPDLTYQSTHRGARHLEEDASTVSPLFDQTLVLRLRFRGWALLPMATDPDPPTDDAGCTGTTMTHAADAHGLDRHIRWQAAPGGKNIFREPRAALPAIGVNGVEATLMAAPDGVMAGYAAIPVVQGATAVQGGRIAQTLEAPGLSKVASVPVKLRFDLEAKNGVRPYLCGNNHVIWHDGEPVDPFVLSVWADDGRLALRREVFNQGKSLLAMTPLERAFSARWPIAREAGSAHIPEWALPKEVAATFDDNTYPSYLAARAEVLAEELDKSLAAPDITAAVSFASRLQLVATPFSTTVNWLGTILHYGHTLSGEPESGDGLNGVLEALEGETGLKLTTTPPGARNAANSRWLVKYAFASMDTDALSHLVYGELFVPVQVAASSPFRFSKEWKFQASMAGAIAALACDFARPFWGDYAVSASGSRRTMSFAGQTITETVRRPVSASGYRYHLKGLSGVGACSGAFSVTVVGEEAVLRWSVEAASIEQDAAVNQVAAIAGIWAGEMTAKLPK